MQRTIILRPASERSSSASYSRNVFQRLVSNQKAFEKGRQERIKFIDEQEKDAEKERDEALNRSYYEMSNGSPYGGGGVLNNPTWFRGGGGYYGGGPFGGAWGGYGW